MLSTMAQGNETRTLRRLRGFINEHCVASDAIFLKESTPTTTASCTNHIC